MAAAGTLPVVARGPKGTAFHVRSIKRYLVLLNQTIGKGGEEDMATKEVWTDSMHGVLWLVDPERNPLCTKKGCVTCAAQRKKRS